MLIAPNLVMLCNPKLYWMSLQQYSMNLIDKYYVKHIASDDDSHMHAHLQYKTNDDKGRLDSAIEEPNFLADTLQCIKVMSCPIFQMLTRQNI